MSSASTRPRGLAQRHGFASVDRRDALGDQPLGVGDRQQRAVEGEAIVAELRHYARPAARLAACRSARAAAPRPARHSAMPSISSSISTGTCACRQRRIGGDGDDAIVVGMQQRLADRGAIDFELGMRVPLETLDDHQIDRRSASPARRRAAARARRPVRERWPSAGSTRSRLRWRRPGGAARNPCPADRCRIHDARA